MRSALLVTALLFTGLVATPALACSAGPCSEGYVVPDQATMPSNHAAFLWVSSRMRLGRKQLSEKELLKLADQVKLRRLDTKALVPVALTQHAEAAYSYLIRSKLGFVPGVEYSVEVTDQCAPSEKKKRLRASMRIVPAVAMPTNVGKVVASQPVRGTLTVATVVGSCSTEIDAAYVDLSVALDEGARAMADGIEYRTFVDGKPWRPVRAIYETALPDRSWEGHGKERVFSHCPRTNARDERPEFALTPGPHRVEMRALLGGNAFTMEPITVNLSCGTATR